MNVKTFMIECTDRGMFSVHRFSGADASKCIHGDSHYTCKDVRVMDRAEYEENRRPLSAAEIDDLLPKCSSCGYEFPAGSPSGSGFSPYWRRPGTEELKPMKEFGPGAMFDADWMRHADRPQGDNRYVGPDGLSLAVICPDGAIWQIDSQASNCTKKTDHVHKCWVRHGVPPLITVDKNGVTCEAGAGSIQTRNWHGFLRNGEFVSC